MRIAELRPEPGNAATAARIEALGHQALRLPLFVVRPLPWDPPDPRDHDALILTSANTLRHGGPDLAKYRSLPVHAVGRVTADLARAAGFDVRATGDRDIQALLIEARAAGVQRALHLGGRDRTGGGPPITRTLALYASDPSDVPPLYLRGKTTLIHSRRAALRLAELTPREERSHIALVAISAAAAAAAGEAWRKIDVADRPDDAAMIERALTGQSRR